MLTTATTATTAKTTKSTSHVTLKTKAALFDLITARQIWPLIGANGEVKFYALTCEGAAALQRKPAVRQV